MTKKKATDFWSKVTPPPPEAPPPAPPAEEPKPAIAVVADAPPRAKKERKTRPAPVPPSKPVSAPAKPKREPTAWRRLLLKKDLAEFGPERAKGGSLNRTLGAGTLVLLGLAGIIGTGIFVLTGVAARDFAGPAIVISFAIAGTVAALAALAYAELSSMIPVSGSAYTYAYAGLGELIAWIIGWDLILEYAVGAMTVAQGWSGYVSGLLAQAGHEIPAQWLNGPLQGGYIDVLALLIVLAVTGLLVYGVRETANATNALVVVKIGIIVFVILLGFTLIQPLNYEPFIPPEQETAAGDTRYGLQGIFTAAGLVFFAYIGFDALSTTAEETRNPRRDLPVGILASLGIATLLYMLVSLVIVGMVPFSQIESDEPLGAAFELRGNEWAAAIIRVGAAAGITSVLVVLLLSQPRIFFAMARDGLLPRFFASVHPTFRTPWLATILTGLVVAVVGALLPLDVLATVTNIGTLFAFGLVTASVIVLRYAKPDAPRGYRVPGPPWLLPGLGALASLVLIVALPTLTLLVFVFWTGVGLVVYAAYGYRKSHAAASKPAAPATTKA